MKNFTFILLAMSICFAKSYYTDTCTLGSKSAVSEFDGALVEWPKSSASDSTALAFVIADSGTNYLGVQSTNNVENRRKKVLTPHVDMSAHPWIVLKCRSNRAISKISFLAYTGLSYAYALINIGDTAQFHQDVRDWYVTADRYQFTYYGAGFSWSDVDRVDIGFTAPAALTDTLICKQLYVQKNGRSKAVILLSSDDAFLTNYLNALPIMDTTNILTTFSVPQYQSNEYTRMSEAQIDSFYVRGHEIVTHSYTHTYFDRIKMDSTEKEIVWGNDWIDKKGWMNTNKNIIIYPHGTCPDSVQKRIRSFTSVGYGTYPVPSRYVTTPPVNYLFLPRSVLYPKTLSWSLYVKKWIDTAIAYRYVLPLFYHGISDTETNCWATDSFRLMCSYLKTKIASGDVEVLTTSQYFKWVSDSIGKTAGDCYFTTNVTDSIVIDSMKFINGVSNNLHSLKSSILSARFNPIVPIDTGKFISVRDANCANVVYLNSTAVTGGNNINVKSLSVSGVTKSVASGLVGSTFTFSGYGFVGGGWSINEVFQALTVDSYTQSTATIPSIAVSTYAIKVWNSDADTVAVGSFKVYAPSALRRVQTFDFGYRYRF